MRGRAKNFKKRLNIHFVFFYKKKKKTRVKDKFHLFANLVCRDKLNLSYFLGL